MSRSFPLSMVVALTVSSCLSQPPAATDLKLQPFSLTISSSGSNFNLGEPIPFSVLLVNTSGRQLLLFGQKGASHATQEYKIEIKDFNGNPVTEKVVPIPFGAMSNGIMRSIESHEVIRRPENLAEHFDLFTPSEYSVQFTRMDAISRVIIRSNTIKIVITDPCALVYCDPNQTKPDPKITPFSLNITSPGYTFKRGQPIPITVALTNTSGKELPLHGSRGAPRATQEYQMEVKDNQEIS